MTALGLLIALVRYGRRAKVFRVAQVAVIGALQYQADIDRVAQLRRARDELVTDEAV